MLAENIKHNTQWQTAVHVATDEVEILNWPKVCASSINVSIVLYLAVSNQ